MTKTINLLAAFVVTLMPGAYGQEVRQMSIGEIFGLTDRQNADIATADSRIATARQGEAVAQNARLPQMNASLTLSYLGDVTILDRDFGNATRDRLPHFSNTLGVELYQPVYTGLFHDEPRPPVRTLHTVERSRLDRSRALGRDLLHRRMDIQLRRTLRLVGKPRDMVRHMAFHNSICPAAYRIALS